jgi:hypothetical protein
MRRRGEADDGVALAGGIAYDVFEGAFVARDFDHAAFSEYESKMTGPVLRPWRWDPPLLWELPTDLAVKKPGDPAILRAGSRLYGHTGGSLFAVDLPAGRGAAPKIAWQQPMEGTAAELLAADGRLFVVTREGHIACFGSARGEGLHRRPALRRRGP